MFSIILREAHLSYRINRVLAPVLVVIMATRACLGPSFVIKCGFALNYLFDFNLLSREQLGKAFEASKVKLLAYTGTLFYSSLLHSISIVCSLLTV